MIEAFGVVLTTFGWIALIGVWITFLVGIADGFKYKEPLNIVEYVFVGGTVSLLLGYLLVWVG